MSAEIPLALPGRHLLIVGSLWILLVVAGFATLVAHSQTPGAHATSPQTWPAASRLAHSSTLPTLVMFAHPKCPCTRASLNELSVLMAHCPGLLTAQVVFLKPRGVAADWELTPSWYQAAAIPAVATVCDDSGREATNFNALTSGEVALYSPAGHLLFKGGITGSRAHEGDNQGLDLVQSILLHKNKSTSTASLSTFGCSLNQPASR